MTKKIKFPPGKIKLAVHFKSTGNQYDEGEIECDTASWEINITECIKGHQITGSLVFRQLIFESRFIDCIRDAVYDMSDILITVSDNSNKKKMVHKIMNVRFSTVDIKYRYNSGVSRFIMTANFVGDDANEFDWCATKQKKK